MAKELPRGVTLGDVVPLLKGAEEYVRRLLGAMHSERKSRGEIVVRLGRTGTGSAPSYRFDAPNGAPLVPYDGATHRPWPPGYDFGELRNWSSAVWTYDQVAALRGSFTRK